MQVGAENVLTGTSTGTEGASQTILQASLGVRLSVEVLKRSCGCFTFHDIFSTAGRPVLLCCQEKIGRGFGTSVGEKIETRKVCLHYPLPLAGGPHSSPSTLNSCCIHSG